MTRAAIYARYSSDLQSAASIDDQVRLCRERASREGWTVAAVYTDAALSGASALRPGYQKLLEDVRGGACDVVLAEALDRISRDQEHVAGFFKQLRFAGVMLVTLAEGEISELHVGLKGTMNALFLKDLADKTRRGLRGRVEQGRSGGGLCYGYKVVHALGPDGQPVTGERRIDDAEAAIVRRIFSVFATGQSPRAIAKELNAEGVPGPSGRAWGESTIRGHGPRGTGILRNELYVGRLVWNRLRYLKDPQSGRRRSRINPPEALSRTAVPELRIVDDVLWDKVQARLSGIAGSEGVTKAKAKAFWLHRRPRHLLTGLIHCGVCGATYAALGRDYLGCSKARRHGTCINTTSLRRGRIEAWLLDALKRELMAPDLVAEFVAAFNAELNRQRAGSTAGRTALERETAELQRKVERLLDAVAEGSLSGPAVRVKLDALEQRQAAVQRQLAGLAADPVRLHPNLTALYRERVARLQDLLADPATATEALELIRTLITRLTVTPDPDGPVIELEGDLAAMVHLAQPDALRGSDDPSVGVVFGRSAKVVAGTGFEPVTFRL